MTPPPADAGGRSRIMRTNPPTLVHAPPAARQVALNIDLTGSYAILEYDLQHAKRLREDLDTMIGLAEQTPYSRARAKDETWANR